MPSQKSTLREPQRQTISQFLLVHPITTVHSVYLFIEQLLCVGCFEVLAYAWEWGKARTKVPSVNIWATGHHSLLQWTFHLFCGGAVATPLNYPLLHRVFHLSTGGSCSDCNCTSRAESVSGTVYFGGTLHYAVVPNGFQIQIIYYHSR